MTSLLHPPNPYSSWNFNGPLGLWFSFLNGDYLIIIYILMAPGIFDSLFNMGLFPNFNGPRDFSTSWQQYRLIHWIKTVCHMLDFFSSPRGLTFWYNSHFIKAQYQRLKNKSYMSIEHSQILACFLHHFITFFFWEVRSSPEGPQFARSVGTLLTCLV